ncbi:Rpn family recombination-promoting nuclease/putative transposase [Nocardia rhamnosiphila]|uniref:Rpn family recombination-promoting nuclease/putative transposase n=1 Tax=Nocardia rhamnosiphila TaxID=426716 RepID=A0ABV2WVS1_9NOCA
MSALSGNFAAVPADPSNPHDAYFRHVLSRPADAASESRSALPENITRRIDWSQLVLQPGSASQGGIDDNRRTAPRRR